MTQPPACPHHSRRPAPQSPACPLGCGSQTAANERDLGQLNNVPGSDLNAENICMNEDLERRLDAARERVRALAQHLEEGTMGARLEAWDGLRQAERDLAAARGEPYL
jgi:hypothetical protein